MYLWHFPIILLLTPTNMQGGTPWWLCLIELALVIGISAFSYFFVENPIRHGAIGNFIYDLRDGQFTIPQWIGSHLVLVVPAVLFIVVSLGGLALVPDTSAVEGAGSMKVTPVTKTVQAAQQARVKAEAKIEARKPDILVIGDSVPMGMPAYGVFDDVFPGGYCDTAVGRQFYDGAAIYAEYRDLELVGNVVVIALGTNGYATDEDAEALMKEIGDEQRVWFVNTRSPEEYVESSNAVIQRVCDNHANAQLIDWYSISADHPDYFDGDGTHLTAESADIYAWMIYDAVKDYLPDRTDEEREAAAEGTAEAAAASGLSEEG